MAGLPAGSLPLFPFASLADVHAWQASYQSGGHQPWHLSPNLTATAFAAFLGYTDMTEVAGRAVSRGDAHTADMLITNAAVVAFDAEPELRRVRAPTLVIGGSADPYYSQDLFRRTAAGIPGGRAVIFPGKGHLYAAASKAAANIALGFLLAQ
jgi:pimeloyl-ACP methyl ester carboxylesterase